MHAIILDCPTTGMPNNVYIFVLYFAFVSSNRAFSLSGYRYGKSLIPISDTDELSTKCSVRALSALGFTPMNNVKQQHTLGSSVQVLVSTPGDEVRFLFQITPILYTDSRFHF